MPQVSSYTRGSLFAFMVFFSFGGAQWDMGVKILNMLGEGKHCNFPLDKLQTIAVRNKA